jgi:hypothetical protein
LKKRVLWWQIAGIVFVVALGVLLHFVYEWSGKVRIFASFSAVNESIWEHMKILFFPMLVFAIIESSFLKEYKNFWNVKFKGILIGLAIIPLFYYLYNGIIGKSPDWLNILIFVIATGSSFIYESYKFLKYNNGEAEDVKSLFLLGIIATLFVIFTYTTPELNIFKDPETNIYGINFLVSISI